MRRYPILCLVPTAGLVGCAAALPCDPTPIGGHGLVEANPSPFQRPDAGTLYRFIRLAPAAPTTEPP